MYLLTCNHPLRTVVMYSSDTCVGHYYGYWLGLYRSGFYIAVYNCEVQPKMSAIDLYMNTHVHVHTSNYLFLAGNEFRLGGIHLQHVHWNRKKDVVAYICNERRGLESTDFSRLTTYYCSGKALMTVEFEFLEAILTLFHQVVIYETRLITSSKGYVVLVSITMVTEQFLFTYSRKTGT